MYVRASATPDPAFLPLPRKSRRSCFILFCEGLLSVRVHLFVSGQTVLFLRRRARTCHKRTPQVAATAESTGIGATASCSLFVPFPIDCLRSYISLSLSSAFWYVLWYVWLIAHRLAALYFFSSSQLPLAAAAVGSKWKKKRKKKETGKAKKPVHACLLPVSTYMYARRLLSTYVHTLYTLYSPPVPSPSHGEFQQINHRPKGRLKTKKKRKKPRYLTKPLQRRRQTRRARISYTSAEV